MARKPIFRRAALDRLACPERLDQLLSLTSRRGGVALAALGLCVALAAVWLFEGRLETIATGRGVVADAAERVVLVIPQSERPVEPGMVVRVRQGTGRGPAPSFIAAEVTEVIAELQATGIPGERVMRFVTSQLAVLPSAIVVVADVADRSMSDHSANRAAGSALPVGSLVDGEVVIAREAPIRLIVPRLRALLSRG